MTVTIHQRHRPPSKIPRLPTSSIYPCLYYRDIPGGRILITTKIVYFIITEPCDIDAVKSVTSKNIASRAWVRLPPFGSGLYNARSLTRFKFHNQLSSPNFLKKRNRAAVTHDLRDIKITPSMRHSMHYLTTMEK